MSNQQQTHLLTKALNVALNEMKEMLMYVRTVVDYLDRIT